MGVAYSREKGEATLDALVISFGPLLVGPSVIGLQDLNSSVSFCQSEGHSFVCCMSPKEIT